MDTLKELRDLQKLLTHVAPLDRSVSNISYLLKKLLSILIEKEKAEMDDGK